MSTLTEIANRCGTDKGTVCSHNPPLHYTPIYERVMGCLRHRPCKILEIGIGDGASLRMWADWLPQSLVFGVDIGRKPGGMRTRTFVADQGDRQQLLDVIAEVGDVDVIIDDGSHVVSDQQISLATLLPHTRLYWIEDLHTSNECWQGQWLYGNDMSFENGTDTVSVLHAFMRTGEFASPFLSPQENASITTPCQMWSLPPTRWGETRLALFEREPLC